jgi:hypothetical protein
MLPIQGRSGPHSFCLLDPEVPTVDPHPDPHTGMKWSRKNRIAPKKGKIIYGSFFFMGSLSPRGGLGIKKAVTLCQTFKVLKH